MELPKYRSHKTVEAVKIRTITGEGDGFVVVPEETGIPTITVSRAYFNKHQPQVGGYYVRYTDGYESFSPAEAFEEGYTRVPNESNPQS